MEKNDYSKYRYIINRNKDNDKNSYSVKKYLISLLSRILIMAIVLVFFAIIYKSNSGLKDNISSYFFDDSISFTKIKKMYDKYLGGVIPTIKGDGTNEVFNEKLSYSDYSVYYEGVSLSVTDSYLVPLLEEGMVVFIGEKEKYGNTIIVENLDGVEFWYGNISTTSLKLYDYVETGSLVGEVNANLYLVFSKDGQYLNYEEYIY